MRGWPVCSSTLDRKADRCLGGCRPAAITARQLKRSSTEMATAPWMEQVATIQMLMTVDPLRRAALEVVAGLNLPDCWIGAGFVRDAIWDHLHGYGATEPSGDVDVIWHDAVSPTPDADKSIEQRLRDTMPDLEWSVKNQARMHIRNGDSPYVSVAEAMRHWPETATAIAVRLGYGGIIEVNAPFGLKDLFALKLRPTPHFLSDKLNIFADRVASKHWIERYPKLAMAAGGVSGRNGVASRHLNAG